MPRLFEGESEPVAIDPILRGVDLALERLVKRDCYSERTLDVIDELRAEVMARSDTLHDPYPVLENRSE